MRFQFDQKELAKNPYVRKVDGYSLQLTTDMRIKLFRVWRKNQDASEIIQMMIEHGLKPEFMGSKWALREGNFADRKRLKAVE